MRQRSAARRHYADAFARAMPFSCDVGLGESRR